MRRARSRGDFSIDWARVRERLAHAQAAAAAPDELTPERARAVMDQRARVLARVPEPAPAPDTCEVLTLALGAERYGIETTYVREVVRLANFTALPGAPEFVLGVTNLRGEILCIVDVRTFFAVPHAALTDLSRMIVLGTDAPEFGLLADRVDAMTKLRADDLLPVPASASGIAREYLRGVTRDALIVLDGAALLRDPRLFVDQRETPTA